MLLNSVKVIALTATATISTLKAVQARLAMDTPVVIGLSPHRSNIHYSVRPYLSLEDLTTMIKER